MRQPQHTAGMVLVGDEAMTPAEYTRYRARRDRENAWARERYAADPEYRARKAAYHKAWREAHPDRQLPIRTWSADALEHRRAYNRERMRRIRAAQKEQR